MVWGLKASSTSSGSACWSSPPPAPPSRASCAATGPLQVWADFYGQPSLKFADAAPSDAVLADLRLYLPKLRQNGILAGHDFGNYEYPGTTRAVLDFFAARKDLPLHLGPDFFFWSQISR